MKVQITLDGSASSIQAIVGLAVEQGVLASYEREHAATNGTKPTSDVPVLVKADRVAKKYQTAKHRVPRHSTGTVLEVRNHRGGKQALVDWDDPTFESDWIAVSALLKA